MSRLFRSLSGISFVSLSAALAPALFAAEPALDRLVPADSALVFSVADIPALRGRFASSPAGRAWSDPEVEKFFAPLFSNADYLKFLDLVKAETGYTPEELLGFATGDVLFNVPLSSLKFAKAEFNADAILALEVGENDAKLRDLIAKQQEKQKDDSPFTETTEDYNGATLHIFTPKAEKPASDDAAAVPAKAPIEDKSLVWTIHQGRWFLASNRELVTRALDAVASGGLSESLSTSAKYRAVVDRAGGHPDYVFFADIQSVYPLVVAGIEASRDPNEQPNPMGIEPINILKALGLDALVVAASTGSIAADGSTASDVSLTYSEARGLVKLIAYRDGPVARPDWIPASWLNATSQNFSIPDLYSEIEQILDRVSPMLAGMATGQIKAFDRQLKIDLKRDLIGNFGPSIVTGIAPPAGSSASAPRPYDEMEQFFAISLADAAAFERTLDAIKSRFLPADGGPLQKREYLGRTLHVFTPPAGAPGQAKGFAYAIADGWLLLSFGSAAPVEAVLQNMHKPDASASFWARSDVRAALEPVPAAAFSVQFDELSPMFASLCALAVKVQATKDDDEPALIDPAAVPTTATFAKYFSHIVSYGERKADGIYLKSVTPPAASR